MKEFLEVLKATQKDLLTYTQKKLYDFKYKSVLKTKDYVFGEGNLPIMLVAHLDTVHKQIPEKIYYDKEQDVLWSPQGIGGDDRCGVYAILQVLKAFKPYVLFTTDEEVGGLGASEFADGFGFPLNLKYIIEIDRRGSNDCVFYQCGNEEFQKYVESFGFKTATGTFTDISVISPVLDVASVNLSSGYYNEHTTNEYVCIKELRATIERIKNMIADEKNAKYFKYMKKEYTYKYDYSSYNKNKNSKFYTEDELWEMYSDYDKLNDAEFKKRYKTDKPKFKDDIWYWGYYD